MAKKLIEDGVLNEEDADIIEYGLDCMVNNLTGIGVTFIIVSVFESFWEAFLLCFMLFPLRKCAGGFHADTRGKCFLFSTGLLLASCILFFKLKWLDFGYLIVVSVFGGIIWNLSPVENENKQLDEMEYSVYKKRTRMILLAESLLFIICFILECIKIQQMITMSLFIVGIVGVTGKLKTVWRQ